jgi:hypothetical protein
MTIETSNPEEMKKVVARAFGANAKSDRLTIEGRGENIYIDFVIGEPKTPAQVFDEIAKRYFNERLKNNFILRDDMLIAKDKEDRRYEKYKQKIYGREKKNG